MNMGLVLRTGAAAALGVALCALVRAPAAAQWALAPAAASTIPASQLLQPEQLNLLLHTKGAEKPLVLQVGSHVMFAEAHIAGSEYAGPGSQDAGLQQLRSRVGPLKRNAFIVIYCGCCPWSHCPNIGPAYKLLHDMGFTRVKALYLADNFGADWADKGYPVESGR